MAARTTWRTSVFAMTASSVCAKFSSTTMTVAPESASWCCSSRAVYSGLTLTTTPPTRRMAPMATRYCGTLGIITATRSPRWTPCDCSQAPSAFERWSTSP